MFFDNASTTKIDKELLEDIVELNEKFFYNPGGLYSKGREVKNYIEDCRNKILSCLGGDGKFVFTGSATEANNLAIMGVLKKNVRKLLFSMGEHPSVYNTALELKNKGYDVEFVNLNKFGVVDIDDFKEKMTKDVDFVSIMHVSNETGAINDISNLVSVAKSINKNVIFHSDGVQAYGKIDVDLYDLDVDLYTISAHKIYGCKGIGGLFVKKGISLKPLILGGGQEGGLRSGTENVLAIDIFAKAVVNAKRDLIKNVNHIKFLKNKFLEGIDNFNIKYSLHSFEDNAPNIISISFDGCKAETILNMLNDNMVYVGNGSACSSKSIENRVLESMGVSRSEVEGNLRISFSKDNTPQEIDKLLICLNECVEKYLCKVR